MWIADCQDRCICTEEVGSGFCDANVTISRVECGQPSRSILIAIEDQNGKPRSNELLDCSGTDDTGTNDPNHSREEFIGRQPPRRVACSVLPLTRSTAAAATAMPRTVITRRMNCMVGLTRVELVTSSLSGMRSNQLSYSPSTVVVGEKAYCLSN